MASPDRHPNRHSDTSSVQQDADQTAPSDGHSTPSEGVVASESAPPPRYCKGCLYDLAGIFGDEDGCASCPECGRDFNEHDRSTTHASKQGPLIHRIVYRPLLKYVAPALVVTALVYTSVIPRPAALDPSTGVDDWRLWVWLGSWYGWKTHSGIGIVGGTELYYWDDRVVRTRGLDPNGDKTWTVARQDDTWTVEVFAPTVSYRQIEQGFRATRDRIIGITIDQRSLRNSNGTQQPFRVVGDEADILSALIRAYDIRVSPAVIRGEEANVWVWDHQQQALTLLPTDVAITSLLHEGVDLGGLVGDEAERVRVDRLSAQRLLDSLETGRNVVVNPHWGVGEHR